MTPTPALQRLSKYPTAIVSSDFWTKMFADPRLNWRDTPQRRFLFRAQERAEGGPATHNPLNTILKEPGSTDLGGPLANGGFPVQNYVSQAQGIDATIKTLLDPRHAKVFASLVANHDPYYTAVQIGYERDWTDGWLMCEVLHDLGYT